jgi:hypothetical protein
MVDSAFRFLDTPKHQVKTLLLTGIHLHQCPQSKDVLKINTLRGRFTHSGENVSGLAGEAIMLCMEPLCVRMMQLASFAFSFTSSYLYLYLYL